MLQVAPINLATTSLMVTWKNEEQDGKLTGKLFYDLGIILLEVGLQRPLYAEMEQLLTNVCSQSDLRVHLTQLLALGRRAANTTGQQYGEVIRECLSNVNYSKESEARNLFELQDYAMEKLHSPLQSMLESGFRASRSPVSGLRGQITTTTVTASTFVQRFDSAPSRSMFVPLNGSYSASYTMHMMPAGTDRTNTRHLKQQMHSSTLSEYESVLHEIVTSEVKPQPVVKHEANRPPIENVMNHLDEFFPGVDLDQPYLEDNASSPILSNDQNPLDAIPSSLRNRLNYGTGGLPLTLSKNESALGSDESTLKAKDRDTIASVTNVAQRQVSMRNSGLSRMKSIREVAKGRNANNVSRHTSSVAQPQANVPSSIVRRKSTKMFGANIVQIRPKPGNRLSTLDPIPQEEVPHEDTPKRQATFKIIRGQLIGKGAYGRVYLSMNATTGEFLAVKQVEVNQKVAQQDKERVKEMVAALDIEIDTMQHLEHPNIVQYLGCERKELSISIYLEYISGGSVGSCLHKHGKFDESVVKSLTRQTLEGLAYLHAEGILHRDLKADNILLDLDGTCKISDFGISKKSSNIYGNDITNSMQGSVFWMAPEVVRSQGQGYSAKVDIWSLGCVVLEMFAGRRPWSREEAFGAIFKLGSLNQAPPIPDDVSATATVDGLNFMWDCFQM